jgi:hypothetical protein
MLAPTLDPTSRRIYKAQIPPQRVLADSGRLSRRQPGRCLKRPAVLALGTVCPPAPIYCASVRRVSACAALSVRCSRARRPFGLPYSRSTYLPSSGSSFSTASATGSRHSSHLSPKHPPSLATHETKLAQRCDRFLSEASRHCSSSV